MLLMTARNALSTSSTGSFRGLCPLVFMIYEQFLKCTCLTAETNNTGWTGLLIFVLFLFFLFRFSKCNNNFEPTWHASRGDCRVERQTCDEIWQTAVRDPLRLLLILLTDEVAPNAVCGWLVCAWCVACVCDDYRNLSKINKVETSQPWNC